MRSTFLVCILLLASATLISGGPGRSPHTTGEILVAAVGGSNPSVAMSPDGKTQYIVWVDLTSDESNISMARVKNGKVVDSSPLRVNDIPGDVAFHHQASPLVAVGPEGNIYVSWQTTYPIEGRMFPASNLKFARSTDGGASFGPSLFVNDDFRGTPTSHTFHAMAVGQDGSVYLSWIDGRRNEEKRMKAAAAGESHGAHGSHHGHGEPLKGPDIRVASSVDGGMSFGASAIVDSVACPCCRTSIAAGPGGELYVAWRKVYSGNIRDIAISRSDDRGRSFTVPQRIHADEWMIDGCPHHGPSLVIGPEGKVHAAWYTGKEGASGSALAVSSDSGESFTVVEEIEFSDSTETSHPSVALFSGGQTIVAAEEWTPGGSQVRVGLVDKEIAELTSCAGTFPAIACQQETGCIAWLRSDSVFVQSFSLQK